MSKKKEKPIQVHIAIIRHRHGQDLFVARSKDKLNDEIYGYVKSWWDEIDSPSGIEMPEDHDEAIELYFDKMEDSESLETYVNTI